MKAAKLTPDHIEVHSYYTGSDFADVLTAANNYAKTLDLPLSLGEMFYQDPAQLSVLQAFLKANPSAQLSTARMWPKYDTTPTCPAVDVPPPYTLGAFSGI